MRSIQMCGKRKETDMEILIVKIWCLLCAIATTPRILGGVAGRNAVTSTYICFWAVAATTFITLQWLV